MRTSKLRILFCLLAVTLCFTAFSATAYAGGGPECSTEEIITGGVEPETEPQPLTPEGNITLVDDIEGGASVDKQFITVVTKNGNYFYIIVDRAEDGENTVHFLNQVDEADLLALMDEDEIEALGGTATCICKDKCVAGAINTDCPVCSTNMTECTGKEAAPIEDSTPDPDAADPKPKEKSGTGGALIVVLIIALAGGGAFYYIKFIKNKPKTKGSADLDDYDYGEDEDVDEVYEYDADSDDAENPEDDTEENE